MKRTDAVDMHVGNRIRVQRQSMLMSQSRLAESIGVSFQQVQKYEKGVNRVGASRLQQIATALNVPVGVFFDGSLGPRVSEMEGRKPPRPFADTAEGVELNRAFPRISDRRVRLALLELAEAIARDRELPMQSHFEDHELDLGRRNEPAARVLVSANQWTKFSMGNFLGTIVVGIWVWIIFALFGQPPPARNARLVIVPTTLIDGGSSGAPDIDPAAVSSIRPELPDSVEMNSIEMRPERP